LKKCGKNLGFTINPNFSSTGIVFRLSLGLTASLECNEASKLTSEKILNERITIDSVLKVKKIIFKLFQVGHHFFT
jgi:hypothetical protein